MSGRAGGGSKSIEWAPSVARYHPRPFSLNHSLLADLLVLAQHRLANNTCNVIRDATFLSCPRFPCAMGRRRENDVDRHEKNVQRHWTVQPSALSHEPCALGCGSLVARRLCRAAAEKGLVDVRYSLHRTVGDAREEVHVEGANQDAFFCCCLERWILETDRKCVRCQEG